MKIKVCAAEFIVIMTILFVLCNCGTNYDPGKTVKPGTLLIYYGYPSLINGSTSINAASAQFGKYDYVVLGAGLEESSHPDHYNTAQIIASDETMQTVFFGYIDLGVTTDNHSLSVVKSKVDKWKDSGAKGIFLDDYSYDFRTDRSRQNDAVDYVHLKRLSAVVNAWNPDDAFSSAYNADYNPGSTGHKLGSNDYYLSESYQIEAGNFQTENDWYTKAQKLEAYAHPVKFKILSITTDDSADLYSVDAFFYAWYSALLHNHTATGWGEHLFSSNDNSAVFRTRPAIEPGESYDSDVINDSPIYRRETNRGSVWVDTQTHGYGFDLK